MKFKKTKRITALVLAAMMASSVASTTITAYAVESSAAITASTSSNGSEGSSKVWVVDQEAYDERVITGYKEYYQCTGCDKKFYFEDYPEENGDGGQGAASDAVSWHLFECPAERASYTYKKEAIWDTIHHDEVGHYEEISIDKSSLVIEEGETDVLTATITPDNDSNVVTWKSSDTRVATVSDSGKVTAVKAGTATITATSQNGAFITCEVTVTAPHVHSYDAPTYHWADDFSTCTATFTCADGDDTKTVDCTVTSQTKDATCNSVGQTVYTATVTMNDQKYTDIKTVTIDKSDDHQWDDGVVTTPATCTEAGVKTYTCTVCEVTKTEAIQATGHTYSAPTFDWSEDYKTCTAAISCENGDDTQTLNCTVSVENTAATCTANGSNVYTATIVFNGKTYTDTKTVSIPATDHSYGEPTFNWSDDCSSCTATIKCTAGDDTQTLDCTVSVKNTATSCTVNGSSVYTATVSFNGKTYTDTKTVAAPATGHKYGEPTFNWSDDCSSCTATIKCTAGDDTQTLDCTVSVKNTAATCTVNGSSVYTATVSFNGKTYTDTKTVSIPATGHNYGEPTFNWSDDRSSCTATFKCTAGDDTKTVNATVEDLGGGMIINYVATVTFNGKEYNDTATKIRFVDVPKGEYYYDAVDWAAKNGITTGTSLTTFSPDGTCTRAQMVMFLWNAAGNPEPSANAPIFSDVNASSWYGKAVRWATENGVTVGTGNNQFSPDDVCTRAQIVTLLYNYMGK